MLNYKTIGLLYTRTCPLSCRHCIIESSPKASGKMTREVAEDYLRTIVHYSPEVCFTGGEPMLYYSEVVELIASAKSLGLLVSMVSGAGWVRTHKESIARERVRGLKAAGLDKLCISWDQYHEEFSSPENAALLASLADEAGIDVVVRGVVSADHPRPLPDKVFGRFPAQFQNLIKLGTARSLPDEQFLHLDAPPTGGCDVVLSPAIEPDGKVYACCGPSRFASAGNPLILGDTNEEHLDTILHRAVRDPILGAILLVGPRGVQALLKQTSAYKEHFRQRLHYNNVCDLCLDLTNSPEIVDALRARLSETDGRAMLAAAEMMHRRRQELQTQALVHPLPTPEVSHAV